VGLRCFHVTFRRFERKLAKLHLDTLAKRGRALQDAASLGLDSSTVAVRPGSLDYAAVLGDVHVILVELASLRRPQAAIEGLTRSEVAWAPALLISHVEHAARVMREAMSLFMLKVPTEPLSPVRIAADAALALSGVIPPGVTDSALEKFSMAPSAPPPAAAAHPTAAAQSPVSSSPKARSPRRALSPLAAELSSAVRQDLSATAAVSSTALMPSFVTVVRRVAESQPLLDAFREQVAPVLLTELRYSASLVSQLERSVRLVAASDRASRATRQSRLPAVPGSAPAYADVLAKLREDRARASALPRFPGGQ
jgi:hypothetical protein